MFVISQPLRCRGFTLLELLVVVTIFVLLATVAIPNLATYAARAKNAQAIGDIGKIALEMERFRLANNDALPDSLAQVDLDSLEDPWGREYQYLNIEAGANPGAVRKNRNLVPLNTDFDLYSMGPDGESKPPLTATTSRDDLVRANNGAFIGLASDY